MATQNDDRYIEMEEKRMKLDERLMEMDEQHRKESSERELQQRREEREFQLKVFAMLTGQGPSMYNSSYYSSSSSWPTSGSEY